MCRSLPSGVDTSRRTVADATSRCGAPSRPALVELRLDAGPDAGRTIRLQGRPIVLGRALGPGRIDDPLMEAHHLVIDPVDLTLTQLSGRSTARVDGVPIASTAAIGSGSVIEIGASRLTVSPATTTSISVTTTTGTRCSSLVDRVLLGFGRRPETAAIATFTDARREHDRSPEPVTVDARIVRRVLVAGPPAERFALALGARFPDAAVTDRVSMLRAARDGTVVAHVADPEATWWERDLPTDAVVISIGVTWRATMLHASDDGSTAVQRFHASGAPGWSAPGCSGLGRSVVAQEVPGTGAEPGCDVVGIPQPARFEREATATDALVELVAHP